MVTPELIAAELAAAIDGDEVAILRVIVRSLATHVALQMIRLDENDPQRRASAVIAQAALDHLDSGGSFFALDPRTATRH